jgi:hypothetical protein
MSGYDARRDREDQRLGEQGVGPYAEDEYADCACCGKNNNAFDLYEVGGDDTTGVLLCHDCTELIRAGEVVAPAEARRQRYEATCDAVRSMRLAARVAQ